jgi:hypothetical protein
MNFRLLCPKCEAVYALPDVYRGKNVRCSECVHIWRAGQQTSAESFSSKGAGEDPSEKGKSRKVLLFTGLGVAGVFLIGGLVVWLARPSNKPVSPDNPGGQKDGNLIVKKDDRGGGKKDDSVVGKKDDKGVVKPVEEEDERFPDALLDPPAGELIRNGNFEQGNRGFQSSYTYSPRSVLDDLTYAIVKNPNSVHRDAATFGDHTSGSGYMMVINGGNGIDRVIWRQSVAVRARADFTFSVWVTNWTSISPPTLEVRINGQSIGRVTARGRCGEWSELNVKWNAGKETSAAIEIYNLNPAVSGNDFAIDDVSLREGG